MKAVRISILIEDEDSNETNLENYIVPDVVAKDIASRLTEWTDLWTCTVREHEDFQQAVRDFEVRATWTNLNKKSESIKL